MTRLVQGAVNLGGGDAYFLQAMVIVLKCKELP